MTRISNDLTFTHHTRQTAGPLFDALCIVYADAYGVEPTQEKTSAFRSRTLRATALNDFELVTAETGDDLVGFAFGYPLSGGNTYWWGGLRPEPSEGFTVETGARTFVLAEIEVRRAWQGRGVGRRLHDELLSGRAEERATLAANPKAADTHAVYEAWGWQMVGQVPGTSGAYFDAYDLFVLPLVSERPR